MSRSRPHPPSDIPLPLDSALAIDSLCAQFEHAWNAGHTPRVESFLELAPQELQAPLVRELLAAEDGLRQRDGQPELRLDECLRRFPGFAPEVKQALEDTRKTDDERTIPIQRPPRAEAPLPRRFGQYELLERIGTGGMGIVYRARQLGLNREVAIKMIRSGRLASSEELERFQMEARAAARLRHPHMIPVHEIGEQDGQLFYSMDLIDGPSLSACVRDHPCAPREAARVVKAIASSVAFAHEHGILHRDLTPNNVLLDQAGEPWVADFGLAWQVGHDHNLTRTGEVMGTPSYMSPEQARGRPSEVGVASDVYSLGAILYFLLTGRPPFQAATGFATIQQVLDCEPVPARRLNAAIDRDVDTICRKCLEKSPSARYATAGELAEDLERYLRCEPIRARPAGPLPRTVRWCRRKPLAAISILVTAAALVGAIQYQVRLSATRQLAETNQYHSTLGAARESGEDRNIGWAQMMLTHADSAARSRPASVDPAALRTLAARALGAWDLRRIGELPLPEDVGAMAFSPDGKRLAVAELLNDDRLSICIYDPATQVRLAVYSVDVVADREEYIRQDARWSTPAFVATAFSPNGRWLAAATRHGKAYCWDTQAAATEPYDAWQAQDGQIRNLQFLPDSRVVATSTDSAGPIHRRDVNERKSLPPLPGTYVNVVFSPDGKFIVSGMGQLRIDDARTQDEVAQLQLNVGDVAVSADGQWLAAQTLPSHGMDGISILAMPSPSLVRQITDFEATDVEYRQHLSFGANDQLLIASCTDDRVRMWEVGSGALVARVVAPGKAFPIGVIDRGGRFLAVAGSSRAVLYEIVHPRVCTAVAASGHLVQTIEFAPGSHTLAAVSETISWRGVKPGTVLQLWDTELDRRTFDTQIVPSWPTSPPADFRPVASSIAFHPQGKEIVWGTSRASLRWVRNRGSERDGYTLQPGTLGELVLEEDAFETGQTPGLVAIQPEPRAGNGRALRMSPGGTVRVPFNRDDLDALGRAFVCYGVIRGEAQEGTPPLLCCGIYKDGECAERVTIDYGERVSSEYQLAMLTFWEWPRSGRNGDLAAELTLSEEPGQKGVWIDRLFFVPVPYTTYYGIPIIGPRLSDPGPYAYSPRGDRLWGLENERRIRYWNLPEMQSTREIRNPLIGLDHGDVILRTIACTDEIVVVGARHGELFVFSARDGRLLRTIYRPDFSIRSVALAASGDIAVVGSERGELRVMDVARGKVLHDLPPHQHRVASLALSKDGQLLFSGSDDRSVRAWGRRENTFVELFRLDKLPSPVLSVRLSDDKQRLAVLLKGERGVRVWNLATLNAHFRSLQVELERRYQAPCGPGAP